MVDTKDWTWTIEQRCPECGFEAATVPAEQVAEQVLRLTRPWPEVLERPGVRARPGAEVWSPLEYACHVRDVCRVFDGRLRQMLTEDDAQFANWDQDQAAVDGDYAAQEPSAVAGEVVAAAAALSAAYAEVPEGAWQRRGTRSNGSQFTVLTLGRYLLHDLAHHLMDVGADPARR